MLLIDGYTLLPSHECGEHGGWVGATQWVQHRLSRLQQIQSAFCIQHTLLISCIQVAIVHFYAEYCCACRCAVFVEDICSIVSTIISKLQGSQLCQEPTDTVTSACSLAGLPHSVYNMVSVLLL